MEPEHRSIALVSTSGAIVPGEFLLWDEAPENAEQVRVRLHFRNEEIAREADEYFSALLLIRSDLEALGLIPRCYGASRNVFPSGMSRGMGVGDRAYKLTLGRQARTIDLVNLFDEGPDVDPVSIEAQELYFREWLRSLS
ncbi:hypothetical protein EP7_000041 [Isosphaeraceae bacterium EP7]